MCYNYMVQTLRLEKEDVMVKYQGPVIKGDQGIQNADWIKTVGRWNYPRDIDEFLRAIAPTATEDGERRAETVRFLRLPVAQKMPDGLRQELQIRFAL